MGLGEDPRHDPRSEAADTSVGYVLALKQPEEMGLTRPVRAEHRDPLAIPDLEVERLHQPGQLEILADDGPLAGPAAPQPHPDVLLAGRLLRRSCLLELGQPRDRS